jgi:integrase
MSGNTKHLQLWKGSFRVRLRVPAECQPIIGKKELIKSLGTGNLCHATKLSYPVIANFHAMIEAARPGPAMVWQHAIEYSQPTGVGCRMVRRLMPADAPMIDVSPVVDLRQAITFNEVVKSWASEKKPTKESIANCDMIFRKLAEFVGHDDPEKLTPPDIVRYKLELLKTKSSQDTVKKYLAIIKAVLKLATDNRQITANPCKDFTFTPQRDMRNSRQDGFSMAEMALMVAEARQAKKAVVRIPVLIASYSGACLAEITEAHKRDFEITSDSIIFHIRLDNRPEEQRIKTEFRARRFPLHSSITNEVKAYLDTIEDGPLFPDIAVDERFGKQSKNAGEQLRKWIKGLGIKRKGIGFHAFRHTSKTAFRRAYPKGDDIRDYLTGHASGKAAADYGRFPIPALREVMESLPSDPLLWELE